MSAGKLEKNHGLILLKNIIKCIFRFVIASTTCRATAVPIATVNYRIQIPQVLHTLNIWKDVQIILVGYLIGAICFFLAIILILVVFSRKVQSQRFNLTFMIS